MSGPGLSEKDLYYYGGLFAGIIIAYVGLTRLGVHNTFVRLVVGLILGVGLGWFLERTFNKAKDGEPPAS